MNIIAESLTIIRAAIADKSLSYSRNFVLSIIAWSLYFEQYRVWAFDRRSWRFESDYLKIELAFMMDWYLRGFIVLSQDR